MSFKVKFWGVRGTVACAQATHIGYGGNTSCIEVTIGGRRIVFDAGTGIRHLGHWFNRKAVKQATLLLSHTHWDHINGFPFFSPAFHPACSFRVMAGASRAHGGIRRVFSGQMTHPFFPVPLDAMKAKMEFEDFDAGDSFKLAPEIGVRTAKLNHPDGATGYRIDHRGKSMCYVTDTEHRPGKPDQNVLGLIEGADLVIYDSTYTDPEFPQKLGWGHSTWQEGVRLCRAAKVKQFIIFHHDPEHDDTFLDHIQLEAREYKENTFVAREGMRIVLS